ncbi:hypothetical protein B0H19DRAFT_163493 [Mycena capillaripes]|nr:hypothetical protein B0H19DRAFT_163493 [Mycena capillaripes]
MLFSAVLMNPLLLSVSKQPFISPPLPRAEKRLSTTTDRENCGMDRTKLGYSPKLMPELSKYAASFSIF